MGYELNSYVVHMTLGWFDCCLYYEFVTKAYNFFFFYTG